MSLVERKRKQRIDRLVRRPRGLGIAFCERATYLGVRERHGLSNQGHILDPLFRILSFVVLGFLLLGVSFVYTRYREKLKRFL